MSLLEEYHEKCSEVKLKINNFYKVPIHLSKINKSGRSFLCEDILIKNSALNDLLNFFSIKYDILKEIHDNETQWIPLQRCLSNIKNDRVVTAIVKQEEDKQIIIHFFKEEIKDKKQLNFDYGLGLIENYFNSVNSNFSLQRLEFNEYSLSIDASFTSLTDQIDVFGDGNDIWDSGFTFFYGLYKTIVSPYLLRKICSNGMTSTHKVWRRYFVNKGLRQKSFNRLINKTLSEDTKKITISSCDNMRKHNASLREFFNARDTCLSVSKKLADTYFNDEEIQEVYKPYKIRYKNDRWLSSANSNLNSYEFFNRLTHCATHQKTLPTAVVIYLNYLASEIFFKGPDLSFRAPDPFSVQMG